MYITAGFKEDQFIQLLVLVVVLLFLDALGMYEKSVTANINCDTKVDTIG